MNCWMDEFIIELLMNKLFKWGTTKSSECVIASNKKIILLLLINIY